MEQVPAEFLHQLKMKLDLRIVERREQHHGRVYFRFRDESGA
jgi:hypothetical protein